MTEEEKRAVIEAAAENWLNEMAEYIIPAVDNDDDDLDECRKDYIESYNRLAEALGADPWGCAFEEEGQ